MKSLDFHGMPQNFNKKMQLYKGERPGSARAKTVAVIKPGEIGMLQGSVQEGESTEEIDNPLIKYFDEEDLTYTKQRLIDI